MSAYGASSRSSVFYNRTKGEVEDAIRALEFAGAHFFRPSFPEGERAERRVGERIGSATARVLGAIPLAGLRRLRPIAAKDVAAAMIQVAKRDLPGVHVYESDQIQALADGASP